MKKGKAKPKETLEERSTAIGGGDITDLGHGYRGLVGHGLCGALAYIELPPNHPDVGKHYDDLECEVNGGLTYGNGRIFGWDYAHAENYSTPEIDMKNALRDFKAREV